MNQTLARLLRLIEENDVKFLRLVFCDLFGVQKNIAIMASQLPHAVEKGVSFDASAIPGFADAGEDELLLTPDPDTFSLLPWRPSEGCVGRFFCHILRPDGAAPPKRRSTTRVISTWCRSIGGKTYGGRSA